MLENALPPFPFPAIDRVEETVEPGKKVVGGQTADKNLKLRECVLQKRRGGERTQEQRRDCEPRKCQTIFIQQKIQLA